MPRKTLFVAQLFITLMMAIMMSGIMSGIGMGFTAEWLAGWPKQALIAWPIAFVLTQGVGPLAFIMAGVLTGAKR